MRLSGRWVAVATLVGFGAAPVLAEAQNYPVKSDPPDRAFPGRRWRGFHRPHRGAKLSERLGQQVAIDNRAGANGIVGLEALKAAPPDGYTIAAASAGPLAVNPFIYSKLPHDTVKDFTHIANMVNFPLLLVAHPSLPVKNVKELIALARSQPGHVTYSHPGAAIRDTSQASFLIAGESEHPEHSVQGHRAGCGCRVVGRSASHLQQHPDDSPARSFGPRACARHRQRAADSSAAGVSDDRGIRPARLRSVRLGRDDRTCEHAGADRSAPEQGDHRSAQAEGRDRPHARGRHRADAVGSRSSRHTWSGAQKWGEVVKMANIKAE